ncbi:MAG: zinc metalloprotease HtpX [Candidatus Portnoybacteria bacterium CG10_big_fil_rev_8_21_14_0_10_38_18]|uniref:Protease HtpX homolog n=1 Tax=Candidatus Portnoybacteria bacterium CG10_big_fil_rev_8_21_14_0_10_38_18 TaxID=1974813 RepID=A0A2M8KD13_9BACT|nr:MAG: zinc metalloprotease HtpX [Candidatus Portnoybacteria bacterium CG10_big_fil_rev_8_21_14_0_10_38_18]
MTLYTHIDSNIRKTWLLFSLFLIIIIGLGWVLSYYFNDRIILFIAVFISIFMSFISYWYSDKIVLSMSRAKPLKQEENPELYRIVENLCITAGLPMPRIYIIDDPSPNAFATGRNPKNAVIAVTDGLLKITDRSELEGVIAHELSHIGNRDILLSTVVVVLVGSVTLIADMFLRARFFRGRKSSEGGGQAGAILMLLGLIFIILSPIFAKLIQLAISRKREFLADASGALLTRYPEGLASALEKISKSTIPLRAANKATAHLYIANPFKNKGLSKLFMTHPPVEERIKRLQEMSV